MNIEDYREFCLSLGDEVEEKLPFTAFRSAGEVLVFYVHGHMFSFFDCNNFSVITLKCQPNHIEELKAQYSVASPSLTTFPQSIGLGLILNPHPMSYFGN
ncbi:MAG: MmcQ/YjbR family DNA-binding protein [Bacteroidales bacterium]|nr:MmcQ/YjbR family DNA-binding protein [Bacteroidales bacterium]